MRKTRDGFALIVSGKDNRITAKQTFQIYDDETVDNICEALSHVPNVQAIPTTLERDVFGRLFHVVWNKD